jgi:hypothetical protein
MALGELRGAHLLLLNDSAGKGKREKGKGRRRSSPLPLFEQAVL